ncbi:ASCH domain-containing protein [soil metagenome]
MNIPQKHEPIVILNTLSIVAPSGDRIRSGAKTIEVRRWPLDPVPFRDLLIVQNQKFLTDDSPFDPIAHAVALVDVLTIRPWEPTDLTRSCATSFEAGWLAWELGHVRPVDYPIVLPARRRIYQLDLDPDFLKISG